jgi:prevent-host-death family protein
MNITATELKSHLGQYLDEVKKEPVFINKTGRASAVLVSDEEYQRLKSLEDAYWGIKAQEAEAQGYVGQEESLSFISDPFHAKT